MGFHSLTSTAAANDPPPHTHTRFVGHPHNLTANTLFKAVNELLRFEFILRRGGDFNDELQVAARAHKPPVHALFESRADTREFRLPANFTLQQLALPTPSPTAVVGR